MMAASLRHFFEALFNPFFICFLLLAISVAWLWLYGDGRVVRSCLLLSLFGTLVASTGWFPAALTRTLESQYAVVMKIDPEIHWIVVLGGGHDLAHAGLPANDLLSSVSIERLVEGVRLYRQLPQAKLIVSGGVASSIDTVSEAAYLAKVASWFGIPVQDIVLEATSINTADEAVEIKKIIDHEPFYLVTSAIHMPRSMSLCLKQGLNPIAAPTDPILVDPKDQRWEMSLPSASNLVRTNVAWHEILGMVWGKIRGIL
jgi:uncharacterized SAM-binding protein YcdF (DUF218 family)